MHSSETPEPPHVGVSTVGAPAAAVPAEPGGGLRVWGKSLLVLAIVAGFGVWCIGLPAAAASLATSSASSALDSLSTSVGVFSNAVSGVSSSSSLGGGKVAQGDYRIEQARELPGLPGRAAMVALDLRADEPDAGAALQPWQLRLPAGVATAQGLQAGQLVTVRERTYGFGLWHAGAVQPFYLVVHDEWAQALQAQPVSVGASRVAQP